MTDDNNNEAPIPFGLEFYNELRRLGLMNLITRGLGYAEIQTLKQADREGVVRIFHTAPYAMKKLIREGSIPEIAARLELEKAKSDMAMMMLMFLP